MTMIRRRTTIKLCAQYQMSMKQTTHTVLLSLPNLDHNLLMEK